MMNLLKYRLTYLRLRLRGYDKEMSMLGAFVVSSKPIMEVFADEEFIRSLNSDSGCDCIDNLCSEEDCR